MSRGATVEEGRVRVVDNLFKDKRFVLRARSKWSIVRFIARSESRGLGDRVYISAPHKFDGVADGRVDSKRNITQNTLSGSNNNSICSAAARASCTGASRRWGAVGGRRSTKLGNTLLYATIISRTTPIGTTGAIRWSTVCGSGRRCVGSIVWRSCMSGHIARAAVVTSAVTRI